MNGNWDDLITEAEAERFVGREQELDLFRKEMSLPRPHSLIFYITGQGGVGKSTLLGRYRAFAEAAGFLLADTDELQRDVPSVLGRFARQFSEQGIQLKRFNERYKTYRQKMNELENDPQAPQGLAALLGRTVIRASYIVGDTIPGLRRILDYTPRESVETQTSEWAEYVARKLTNKDEVALIRDPLPLLTSLFFEDLNEFAQRRRFLLCFENFEATRQELQTWSLRLREYKPSLNVSLAIAGRNPPGAQWDSLRRVTNVVRLDVFTEQEAEAFLNAYSITDAKRREEIIASSNRLPVLMSWLAAPEGEISDTAIPTHDIVDRFLRQIADPALRRVALIGAIPRFFNIDLLTSLLSQEEQPVENIQTTFEWLQTMPFVRPHPQGWLYHDVVRRMLLSHQRQSSPQTYRHLQTLLANVSDVKRHALQCSPEEQWTHEIWRTETLVWLYHTLAAEPHKHWGKVMDILVIAMRKRRTFALEIVEALDQEDIYDELTRTQKQTVQLVKQQLRAIEQGEIKDGLQMFEALCHLSDLSPQAKGYLLAYRGECLRQDDQYERALQDFQEALHNIPEDIWAFARRGAIYHALKRYDKALADFDRALALDETNSWALANRGATYHTLKRYDEALADFDRALALDETDARTLYRRALLQLFIGQQSAFHRDISAAITAAQSEMEHFPRQSKDFYRLRFNIAVYLLANGSIEAAQAEYAQLLAMCQVVELWQAAIGDVKELLDIQPTNELAQQVLHQLEEHTQELILTSNL
ncbi:MAG TPA: tetratricopeptide repeat protein [Ktedonobacteraceae bacterium]|jgi:tetratricopeptide (TPR) repeat protein